jgi:hypothetical protein
MTPAIFNRHVPLHVGTDGYGGNQGSSEEAVSD